MGDYEVELTLSDGRIVVVQVQAVNSLDAQTKAQLQYLETDRNASFGASAPVVRQVGATTSGASAQGGAGRSFSLNPSEGPTQDPVTREVTGGGSTATLGSTDQFSPLTRRENINELGILGQEEVAIQQSLRDLFPSSRGANSIQRSIFDRIEETLVNAFQGASATGTLSPNPDIGNFIRGLTPGNARSLAAQNALSLIAGQGRAGDTAFDAAETTDQIVTAVGALGSPYRRGIQGRLSEFNREFTSNQLNESSDDRASYNAALDTVFPNLRRTLQELVGSPR